VYGVGLRRIVIGGCYVIDRSGDGRGGRDIALGAFILIISWI
jgi:hypothetical protein